jgi:ABC-type amino acid transport substrate-binding protein
MISSSLLPRRGIAALCCAALLSLSAVVVGCGSSSSSPSSTAAASSSGATSSAAGTTSAATSSAAGTTSQAAGKPVTIGVDPTSMPYAGLSHGQLIGMDADIARAVAKQAGLKLNLTQLTFDNAIPALKSGRADVSLVGGWFDDATRQSEVNVVSYYQAPVGFVVKQGNPSHVGGTWQGRCGLNLATYTSSPDYLNILKADSAKCTKAGKKAITVSSFAGLAPGVLAVRSGRVDGFMDGVPAVAYQAKVNHLSYVPATDQPNVIWGIAVRKNDSALAMQIANALKALTASGQVAQIWKKYGFPSSITLSQSQITVNGKYKNG